MSNFVYWLLIVIGILACSTLSVFILSEFLRNIDTVPATEEDIEPVKEKIQPVRKERVARQSFFAHIFGRGRKNVIDEAPTSEIVAAITASLSSMLGVPSYNIIIKGIRKGGVFNA